MSKKSNLGKGLEALISQYSTKENEGGYIDDSILISKIKPNRNQPRKINVDLARVGANYHYTTEDQISVAKYNPYQCMDLWQEVDPATSPKTYETTMQDVTSKYYPNGGIGSALTSLDNLS